MGAVQFNPKDYSLNNPITLNYRNNGNGEKLVSLNQKVNGGDNNFWVNPSLQTGQVGGVSTVNPFGISIPQNHSYTLGEDGYTPIATGQDGYGLAHKDPNEYNFHLIA